MYIFYLFLYDNIYYKLLLKGKCNIKGNIKSNIFYSINGLFVKYSFNSAFCLIFVSYSFFIMHLIIIKNEQ